MCNLYTTRASRDEVASYFSAKLNADFNAGAGDVYPGGIAMVVREEQGERVLQAMTWGFPLPQLSKRTGLPIKPKAVNNARTDKLKTAFWRSSFENRRCLIPATAFAEAEGEKGSMTRTWLSIPDEPIFACAGIWRYSDEWGPVYSMVMTDPCAYTVEVHDRMPVILKPVEHDLWLQGAPAEAFERCQPYSGLVAIERTVDPWAARR